MSKITVSDLRDKLDELNDEDVLVATVGTNGALVLQVEAPAPIVIGGETPTLEAATPAAPAAPVLPDNFRVGARVTIAGTLYRGLGTIREVVRNRTNNTPEVVRVRADNGKKYKYNVADLLAGKLQPVA